MSLSWVLLPYSVANPAYNMALDEALFLQAEQGYPAVILRCYGWNPWALSLGRNQEFPYHLQHLVPIVRRMTGGKAVYHADELTYSIVFPRKLSFFSDNLLETYLTLSQALQYLLNACGIVSETAAPDQHRYQFHGVSASCFAQPAPYEILVRNKKIIGSAQKRGRSAVIQHGSIIRSIQHDTYKQLFPDEEPSECMTSLASELSVVPDNETLMLYLVQGFSELFQAEPERRDLTAAETTAALKLFTQKHSTQQWIEQGYPL